MWKHLSIALSFLINKVKKRHLTVGFDTEDLEGGEIDALTTGFNSEDATRPDLQFWSCRDTMHVFSAILSHRDTG
jgi:hypothetical protein